MKQRADSVPVDLCIAVDDHGNISKFPTKPNLGIVTNQMRQRRMAVQGVYQTLTSGGAVSAQIDLINGSFTESNFKSAQILFLDFDNDTKIVSMDQAKARAQAAGFPPTFGYETYSSRAKGNKEQRFRLAWVLDQPIKNLTEYKRTYAALSGIFGGDYVDTKCSNGNRIFLGTDKGATSWINNVVTCKTDLQKLAPELPALEQKTTQDISGEKWTEGSRSSSLISLAGTLINRGLDSAAIGTMIRAANASICDPPLPEKEVESLIKQAGKYQAQRAEEDLRARMYNTNGELNDKYFFKWSEPNQNGTIHRTGIHELHTKTYIMQKYHIFKTSGILYLWIEENEKFVPDTGAHIRTEIENLFNSFCSGEYSKFVTNTTVTSIYSLIYYGLPELNETEVNLQPKTWINFTDCYYDAETGETHPHKWEYKTLNQIPWAYEEVEPATKNETWENFVSGSLTDPEEIELLYAYIGYCMTSDTGFQKFVVLQGEGGTGKSVLLSIVRQIIGEENTSAIALQDLELRFTAAGLAGNLCNICPDLPVKAIYDNKVMKLATGEDVIHGERKFKDGFDFKNYAKLFFSTNSPLRVPRDPGNAFARRVIILPWNGKPAEPDIHLSKKLQPAIPWIIKQSLTAVQRAYAKGKLPAPASAIEALENMQLESDVIAMFIEDCCEQGEKPHSVYETATAVYEAYLQYCVDEHYEQIARRGFSEGMREKGHPYKRTESRRGYEGIVLKSDIPKEFKK